ncbi:mitotic cohesin complex [Lentinula edodes]|uniref:Mitotic cohesin complex n=1 Tax=Lentinula edodes TaxID=5353 RepID=A0A1Q3E815_LENED|nr:mitotic cohesin complex [Lentinula edodes]
MSSTSSPAGPRRSQRDKKPAKPITTVTEPSTTSRKRKHADTDNEELVGASDHPPGQDDDSDANEVNMEGSDSSMDEDERPRKSLKRKKGALAKRPRTAASSTRKPKAPRVPKDSAATNSRKRANVAPNAPFDPASITKVTNISSDNPLFNAILNPNAALQGTVEDYLESLHQDENQALAELVNMILRCCACNDTIDGDTAVDYDGVVDRLDDMAEELKKITSPAGTYPLISKASPFHVAKPKYSFRASLSEFISRLMNSSALFGSIYNNQLIETLQVWLVPMSSSQIRSIRHTSTVIALEVEAALCQVAKEVEKEVELTGRMKEGEKKRARNKGNTTSSAKGKDKELDAKLHETQERQKKLEEFIKEFINGVFIHRYRDLDPLIRTECISSLSTFFETLPSHFCTGSDYLRYVGWVLSDPAASVRLAAVKALQVVYEGAGAGSGSKKKKGGGEAVVIPALRHFTTRFLPRLLEIARFDVDIGVRVAVMNVLGSVDELALLPEDDRNRLGTLVFSDENRVRKGVGRFVSGVWEEWVEEKLGEVEAQPSRPHASNGRGRGRGRGGAVGNKGRNASTSDVDRDKIGIKGLARLLVRWGRALDHEHRKKSASQEEQEEDEEDGSSEEQNPDVGDIGIGLGASDTRGIAPALVTHPGKTSDVTTRGRLGLAVEALWDDMDVVRDWAGILDMLILDHSASGPNDASDKIRSTRKAGKMSSMKKRGKQMNGNAEQQDGSGDDDDDDDDSTSTSTRVDQSWRLSEAEEGALLEVLVASLRRTRKDDDSAWEPITQALIKALPRLFIKYQTDEIRIVDVLTLPTLMNLEVYLEMRETNAYLSLWTDISKQFLTHTSSYVITTAAQTIISHLLANTTLSHVNSEQILGLEDELASSLRDAVAGPVPPTSSPTGNGESSSSRITRDIEICHLTEDEVSALTSVIFRLRTLAGHRDMSSWMEDNEGGKHSSAWDILCAVSERARLSVGGEGEMLEQSLQLLTLYIMWKSRRLLSIAGVSTSTEDVQDREQLINQRDSHVDKLIEYAVGTQVQGNGIVEGVKRVAFKNLLDLYVLFLSAPPNDAENTLPSLTMTMNDEVQWRCAGYIQAEVERYADAVNHSHNEDSNTEDDQTDDSQSEGDAEGQSKKNKKATKKTDSRENDSEVDFASRPLLEQEYVFIDVISTFLRAMRTGVIQVRHGAVLLAHYGRLGPAFDSCAKLVIEILKDEGLLGEHGQLIVLVVTQAMREAFNVHRHSKTNDDTKFAALGKLLSSCFILRGGQLTILRRLDVQLLVEIHTSLLSWIIKQIGARPSSNSKDLKSLLSFFQGLVPLVSAVQNRDALRIKAHLDQAWVQAKVEPGATKIWEPLRAYEKRLGTAMGKDKPSVRKARSGKKKKDVGLSTDGEETEVEKLVDEEHPLSDNEVPLEQPPRPRPRPRRATKKRAPEPAGSDSDPEPTSTHLHPKAVHNPSAAASDSPNVGSPVTIGKRPRADTDEETQDNETTPRPSHKRSRREGQIEESELQERDEEVEEQSPIPNGNVFDTLGVADLLPVQSSLSGETGHDTLVPKRKKRIRH